MTLAGTIHACLAGLLVALLAPAASPPDARADASCAPLPPTDPRVGPAAQGGGNLVRWSPPVVEPNPPLLGYRIYRAPVLEEIPPAFEKIGEVGPDVLQFLDAKANPGTRFVYGVSAFNACGEGPTAAARPDIPRCDLFEPVIDTQDPTHSNLNPHPECLVEPGQ